VINLYIDYIFYRDDYGGKVPEDEFLNLELKAVTLINYYTFNRIIEVTDDVKFAVCELIDYFNEIIETDGKEISSEKVASYSVSYVVDGKSETIKQRDIISKYLGHSGLMYRGP